MAAGGGIKINNISVRGGADGKTPIFKIENGNLYNSYTSGTTWNKIGEVKGAQGDKGKDGNDGKDAAKLVRQVLRGTDERGGNIYLQTYDDGSTFVFTAPKGDKGDKGDKGEKGDVSIEQVNKLLADKVDKVTTISRFYRVYGVTSENEPVMFNINNLSGVGTIPIRGSQDENFSVNCINVQDETRCANIKYVKDYVYDYVEQRFQSSLPDNATFDSVSAYTVKASELYIDNIRITEDSTIAWHDLFDGVAFVGTDIQLGSAIPNEVYVEVVVGEAILTFMLELGNSTASGTGNLFRYYATAGQNSTGYHLYSVIIQVAPYNNDTSMAVLRIPSEHSAVLYNMQNNTYNRSLGDLVYIRRVRYRGGNV